MFQYERQALDRFLATAKYPCNACDLVDQANNAGVPHQVVLLLQRLEDRQYSSGSDVEQELTVHKA